MFLHIGGDVVIPLKSIVCIIDVTSALKSKDSKAFFKVAEEEVFIKKISKEETKTYIITEKIEKTNRGRQKVVKKTIYSSPISSVTLYKRANFIDENLNN